MTRTLPVYAATGDDAPINGRSAPSSQVGPEADRGADGRFVRGNAAALKAGDRSAQFWLAVGGAVDDLAKQIIADAGYSLGEDVGANRLPVAPAALKTAAYATARAAVVEKGTFLRMIETGGPATMTDRTRAAASRWQSASSSLRQWLQLVGLEGQAKAALTVEQWAREQSRSGGAD